MFIKYYVQKVNSTWAYKNDSYLLIVYICVCVYMYKIAYVYLDLVYFMKRKYVKHFGIEFIKSD
jgi:hypothetical protein